MITLTINGSTHTVEIAPATPLLYVLHDALGFNSARFGCGLGQCGACTVLVDDKPVFSCVAPAGLLEGRKITTVEGLGSAAEPGPVQRAFLAEQAAECGYCIPGLMMRVEALRRRTPYPSEAELRAALAPSLCRCGTHMAILRAARRALAEPRTAERTP
jgi:nicotinate dehydrogenase subunit A